ncbi:GIY-YIG nuclease family protein [Desulfotomaculum defluvii]
MDRKKELKEQYKQMKPPMGIIIIRCHADNKCYIEVTPNLKGKMNSATFQLKNGSHRNRELQRAWQEHGEGAFTVEVLENLEYDKDETKTDYTEDLALLKMIWEEKLAQAGMDFYKK